MWEKEKMLVKSNFSFFQQYFLLNQMIVSSFAYIFDIKSLFAAEMEEPKINISGKGLKVSKIFFQRNYMSKPKVKPISLGGGPV